MKLFIFIGLILLFSSCGPKYSKKTPPSMKLGEMNLKSWDFKTNGPLDLDGEWLFYWNNFVSVKDVLENKLPKEKPHILKGTGELWDSQLNLPGEGYGTLIFRIKNLQKLNKLRIYFHQFGTAAEIFISDGKNTIKMKSGQISTKKETAIPQGLTFDKSLAFMEKNVVIVVHISNYYYRAGGFWGPPKIYYNDDHFSMLGTETILEFFVLGSFFIVAVYHLAIFTQRRKDFSSLFLGLFCLTAFFRFFSVASYSFIFTSKPSLIIFTLEKKLEYLSMLFSMIFLFEYLFLILKIQDRISQLIKKYLLYVSLVLSLFPLILSPSYFTHKLILNSILMIVLLYSVLLIFFVVREVIKKTPNSMTFFLSIQLASFGLFYDILIGFAILYPPEILPLMAMVFIFIQSNIVASNFGEDFKKVERLTNKLNEEVDRKTGQIKDQNKDFLLLLSNLNQGFLTFNQNGEIEGEATDLTKSIFEDEIKGQNFEDILELKGESRDNLKKWLNHSFKGIVPFKDLTSLAPKEYKRKNGDLIELTYKPIYKEESKKLDKIICIATDITHTKDLEEKALLEKEKGQMIFSLIERPIEFIDAIDDARDVFEETLQNLELKKPDQVFRNIHTLKARLASFKMRSIVGKIHSLEGIIQKVKSPVSWTPDEIQKTRNGLLSAYDDLKIFLKENRKLIEVANKSVEDGDDYEDIIFMKSFFREIVETYANKFVFKEVHSYFQKFVEPTKELARSLDKQIEFKIKTTDLVIAGDKYKKIFSSFLHVFRNIIDHGVESISERTALKKPERALIEVSFQTTDNGYFYIHIKDDGRGIDPKQIYFLAKSHPQLKDSKLQSLSDHDLIQLIFFPGISSKTESTDISGRGIGMDAVKSEIEKIGGTVKVKSQVDKGTMFTAKLPILIPFVKE